MTPLHIALAVVLILGCGVADRVIGWGKFGRAIPVVATFIGLTLIAFKAGLPPLAVGTFAIPFFVWRTPGWGQVPGGTINPGTLSEVAGTFVRHCFAIAFVVPAFFAHKSLQTLALMVGFAVVATLLAVYNYFKAAHTNQTVEFARGLALGAFLSAAFIL